MDLAVLGIVVELKNGRAIHMGTLSGTTDKTVGWAETIVRMISELVGAAPEFLS
jgi:hypothetical protein